MRYGIISDIHGNLEALDAAIGSLSREKIDKYVCVGDIVGYGADPRECISKTRKLNPFIVCGNHDAASCRSIGIENFNEAARKAVIWTRKNLVKGDIDFLKGLGLVYENEHFTLVHGALREPGKFHYIFDKTDALETFDKMKSHLCFIGHSHIPGVFSNNKGKIKYFYNTKVILRKDTKYIVNVGSIGQPRDGDPRLSYFVLDTRNRSLSIKRIPYNMDKAQKKILDAGLPPFLAERLKKGM